MKNKYDIKKPMASPWLMYPHISRYSIGWRMGYGENYICEFGEWFSSLTLDQQNDYQKLFPEPIGWLGWYSDEDKDIYDGHYLLWNNTGVAKYLVQQMINDNQCGKLNKYLFFWGHQPSSDESITKTCLSQWWMSDFNKDIDKYCCMEQFMMSEKAKLFEDEEVLQDIMNSKYPKQIKELGRKVRNFNEDTWQKRRYSIILNGNYAKFIQNNALKQFLLGTKNRVLVEASPYDKIWGIGMSADERDIEDPTMWKGLNLLGFALMEVRDELFRICQNERIIDFESLHKEFD